MASSSSYMNPSSPGLKTYFKSPEGRYKLQYEKSHSAGIIHYSHGKSVSQLTIAYLKEKQASQGPTAPSTPGSSGVVKSVAARLFVGVNGSKTFSFGGSNGGSKMVAGSSRFGGTFGASAGSGGFPSASNYDGKGAYLIFNAGDSLFISDLNSQNKDPIKYIHFSISIPLCHAFDSEAKDGHDLLVGLHSGEIYTASLRQQLQDPGKKLVGAQHYNKDGAINNSRCTCVAWVPDGDGIFVSAHADGNLYVYGKNKDGAIDPSFSVIKDPTQFSVTHARSSKCNPIIRWHISQGLINNISFSMDGTYLATVGRDGYLRVFDYHKEQLIFGGKSYYGALLCCAWSPDGKYILTGGVSFDSYWSAPSTDGKEENAMYRFGSVGQDTQLLLWDLEMDEISLPLRYPPTGGSPTFSSGSNSARWDALSPIGTLQPSPCMRDVPKLSPLTVHRVHVDPLSGLIFTEDSVVSICREGHIKIWSRPGDAEIISQPNFATFEGNHDKHPISSSRKVNGTSYKQMPSNFPRN